jgi:hypothetical protein
MGRYFDSAASWREMMRYGLRGLATMTGLL